MTLDSALIQGIKAIKVPQMIKNTRRSWSAIPKSKKTI